jgi:hypothetical protein
MLQILKQIKINRDTTVAFSAIVMSIATLIVSVYQISLMRNQLHTSVWPYVEWLYNNANNQFYITVENKGIGPAIIKGVEMKLDEEPMGSNSELLKTLLGNSHFNFINSTVKGRVISPGETVEMLHVFDSKAARAIDSLLLWNSSAHTFELRICYCSVFGDCWETDGNTIIKSQCN